MNRKFFWASMITATMNYQYRQLDEKNTRIFFAIARDQFYAALGEKNTRIFFAIARGQFYAAP